MEPFGGLVAKSPWGWEAVLLIQSSLSFWLVGALDGGGEAIARRLLPPASASGFSSRSACLTKAVQHQPLPGKVAAPGVEAQTREA
jgi:hypothetical protein